MKIVKIMIFEWVRSSIQVMTWSWVASFQWIQWRKLIYNGLCCINQYHTLVRFKIVNQKPPPKFHFSIKNDQKTFYCPKILNLFRKTLIFLEKFSNLEIFGRFSNHGTMPFYHTHSEKCNHKIFPTKFLFFRKKVSEKPLLMISHRYWSYKMRSFQGHF